MTIRFSCRCGKKLKTPDDRIGRKVLCPDCGSPVIVPDKNTAAVSNLPDAKSAMVTSSTAGELLRQSSVASKRTQTEKELEKSLEPKEPWVSRDQMRQILTIGLPGLIVICFSLWGVYRLASIFLGPDYNYPPLARVTGVVTLNGEPLAGATIVFRPVHTQVPDSELKISASRTKTNEKGEYEIYYTSDKKGAYIGKHRIHITKTDPQTGKEIVPLEYNRTTEELREVLDEHNEFDFPLEGPPPSSGRPKKGKRSSRRRK